MELQRTKVEFFYILLPLLVVFSGMNFLLYLIFESDLVILFALLYMLVPIVMFLLYKVLENMVIYVIFHISIVFLVAVIAPNVQTMLLLGITTLVFAMISVKKKRQLKKENVLPKTWSYYPALYIVLFRALSERYTDVLISTVISLTFIVYILLYKYNEQLEASYVFLSTTTPECRKVYNKTSVIRRKMWMGLFGIVIFSILVLALIPEFHFFNTIGDKVAEWMKYILLCIFEFIRRFIKPMGLKDVPVEEPVLTPTPTPDVLIKSSPKKLRFNDEFFYVILGFMGVFVIFVLIVAIIYAKNNPIKDEEFNEDEESKIKKEKLTGVRKKIIYNAEFSEKIRQKVRKIFYKSITNNVDKCMNINKSFTPKELCDMTNEDINKEQLYDMSDIYKKARYSNEEITNDDYKYMKKLSGRIRDTYTK